MELDEHGNLIENVEVENTSHPEIKTNEQKVENILPSETEYDKQDLNLKNHWILRIKGNQNVDFDEVQLSPFGCFKIRHGKDGEFWVRDNGPYTFNSWDFSYHQQNITEGGDDSSKSSTTRPSSLQHRWSMHSFNLLTITYRPHYQALPSYTNMSATRDYLSRLSMCTTNGTVHQTTKNAKSCGKAFQRSVDWIREVYTYDDICKVDIKKTDEYVKGVGPCIAVEIVLSPKRISSSKKVHLSSPSEISHLNSLTEEEVDAFDDANLEKNTMNNSSQTDYNFVNNDNGPVIIFAIPKYTDDTKSAATPLLWKVIMPPNPSIAIETVTILNGKLSNTCTPTATESKSSIAPLPTHIFINGWQSWSFAGNVQKDKHQPSSAMPDVFSYAFNNGASSPPISRLSRKHTQNIHLDIYNEDDWNNEDTNYFQSDFFTAITSNLESTEFTDGNDFAIKNEITNSTTSITTCKNNNNVSRGPAMVLGWLSQRHQFGLVTMDSNLSETISMHCSFDSIIKPSEKKNKTERRGKKSRDKNVVPWTETDWAWCQILSSNCYQFEPMANYLDAVARYNNVPERTPLPLSVGWCSWYHYYQNITIENLLKNFDVLGTLVDLDCNVAIVDDGYMTAWGDWDSLKPKAFPQEWARSSGSATSSTLDEELESTTKIMKGISNAIRANGMRPGLWLAPYAADKFSDIAKLHPDWIIKNERGRPANSANCGKFFYGLDATNPKVRSHAFNAVRRAVQNWGFEVLKLDFLYAACLAGNGKYDNSLTRAETMYLALKNIREAAGADTFIIGCGCPQGSGIEFVDAMRISADTGPTWAPEFPLPWWDNGTLPSLRGMLRNTINRANLGFRWWHNDPDCILLGDTTKLSYEELVSASSIVGMTSGMLLLSDDLPNVSEERLDVAKKIYPVTGATAVPLDLYSTMDFFPCVLRLWCSDISSIRTVTDDDNGDKNIHETRRVRNFIKVANNMGTWSIVSVSNWTKEVEFVGTPLIKLLLASDTTKNYNGYHVFSFWSSQYLWIPTPAENPHVTLTTRLMPHDTEIFHLKPVLVDRPQYIGSTLHFSCGFEVKTFEYKKKTLILKLKDNCKGTGCIFLFIPGDGNDIKASLSSADAETSRKSTNHKVVRNLTHPNKVLSDATPASIGKIISLEIAFGNTHDKTVKVQF